MTDTDRITEIRQRNAAIDRAPHIRDDIAILLEQVGSLQDRLDEAEKNVQTWRDNSNEGHRLLRSAESDLAETKATVDRVAALAADLQRRGDDDGARLIFAALNGERA